MQGPLDAMDRMAAHGRIRIGWSSVRVVMFGPRPTQCFRCWEYGHVRSASNSVIDRSGHCFKCGEPGHRIGDCGSSPCLMQGQTPGCWASSRLTVM